MPGRRPYPLRVIESTKTKHHYAKADFDKRRKKEPIPGSTILRCPGRLDAAEKKEWRRIVKLYREIDGTLLSDLDANLLEQYVVEWARWQKARAEIRHSSEVLRDPSNNLKTIQNPWLDVERSAGTACQRIGSLLMLDVVSRARAGMKKEVPQTDAMTEAGFNV